MNGETSGDASTTAQSESSSTAAECTIGSLGCPCTQGGACDPGLACSPEKVCVDDGGSGSGDDSSGTTAEPASSSSGTTAEPTECDPVGGQPSLDCSDPAKPFCAEAGVCGGCTVLPAEMGCAQLDAGKPFCNPEDGRCVECTAEDDSLCVGNKPACDLDTNACVGCFEHSHCPQSACDLVKRECFPTDKIVHVRLGLPGESQCTLNVGEGGTKENPYCFLQQAIDHAQLEGPTPGWVFKMMKTTWTKFHHPYAVFKGTQSPVSYALIHEPGDPEAGDRHTRFVDTVSVMTVGVNVTVFFDNFGIENVNGSEASNGLQCLENARVFLDDSYIRGARGVNLLSIGCDLDLRRSSVTSGWTEGIQISDGKLHMRNSYVTNNKFFADLGGGGIVATNTELDILYSTIVGNNNELMAGGDSIDCRDDNVTGTIRNSVIGRKSMGNNPSIQCNPLKLEVLNSVLDSDEFKTGNFKIDGETILSMFAVNLNSGAFKIIDDEAADQLKDKAVWQQGDPRRDYDGDPRNAIVGQVDYAGADVWTP